MKRNSTWWTLILLCTLGSPFCLRAQTIPERENPGVVTESGKKEKFNLYKDMNLSKDQQKKMTLMARDIKAQMKTVNEDSTLTRQERRRKLITIREDASNKRKAILSAKQMEQYEKNLADSRTWKKNEEDTTARVTNNEKRNNIGKDENGLSRKMEKKASKKSGQDLELSADQKKKLLDLTLEKRDKERNIMSNLTLSKQERESQLEQLRREQNMALDEILTPAQKAAWIQKQRDNRLMRTGKMENRGNLTNGIYR